MSLTSNDLSEISNIIESALTKQSNDSIKPIQGEIEALSNDIKEIYDMISGLQHNSITDKGFEKLPIEKKILTLNAELLIAAKQLGIELPR